MTLTAIVSIIAQALTLAIIVRALLSWFPGVRALAPVAGDRPTRGADPPPPPRVWRYRPLAAGGGAAHQRRRVACARPVGRSLKLEIRRI